MKYPTLLLGLAILMASVVAAAAEQPPDVLVVLLEESNGNKGAHWQKSPHESCLQFLREYRQILRTGGTVTLTFESPRVTGNVLAASCILPDGTIEGDIQLTPKQITIITQSFSP